jgi:amidohydrolase
VVDTPREISVDTARQAAIAAIDAASDSLIRLSKFIHSHPEIALQEFESSNACTEFLEERGFDVARGVAELPTAFSATVGEGDPHIAYLSEYDALPNLGHGCGHNLIAIAGIGAGLGLAAALPYLPGGRVTVFGTPAEEAVGGKIIMAEAGLFEEIDAAMGAHPGTSEATCPTVEGSGQALACVSVRIAFHGQAAHAAADPWNGRNALNAVIATFNGVDALRQHVKSDARLHGIITHGGDAPNVVPHYAAAEFYVRGATVAYMDELVEKVRKIAEGAALVTGCELEFSMPERPNFDMIVNYPIARAMQQHITGLGLEMPEAMPEPASGSTDWGNVSYVIPSVETGYPILDRVCTWHSQDVVDASDSELGYANTLKIAKAMALTGIDLLSDPDLLATAKAEFAREKKARQS